MTLFFDGVLESLSPLSASLEIEHHLRRYAVTVTLANIRVAGKVGSDSGVTQESWS